MIAEVAVVTGIAPAELQKDGQMLMTIVDVLNQRNRRR